MSEIAGASSVKLLFSVPSLGLDDSKGPPSLVFVTHELPFHDFPYSFPEDAGFFITNGWLGDPGAHRQRIALLDPAGALVAETGERDLSLLDDRPYTAITYFMGLTFEAPGKHTVKVWLDGAEVLSYPLFVTLADPLLDDGDQPG